MTKFTCPDCGAELSVPSDVVENEVISCSSCGAEYIYKAGNLVELELTGEDWGE